MENLSWPAMRIFQYVRNLVLPGNAAAARFPTSTTIQNVVKNTRSQAFGNNKIEAITLKYGSRPKSQCFLLSNVTWVDEKGLQVRFSYGN